MAYFKYNIEKVDSNIDDYKSIKKECKDDINYVYKNFIDIDAVWNDDNSVIFTKKLKDDNYFLDLYFEYLDNLYKHIENFNNTIKNILNKNEYYRVKKIKYDDELLSKCKENLYNALQYLNNTLENVEVYSFSNSIIFDKVLLFRTNVKSLKKQVSEMIEKINSFSRSMNELLRETQLSVSRIDKMNFTLKNAEYRWRTNNATLRNVNVEEEKKQFAKVATISDIRATGVNLASYNSVLFQNKMSGIDYNTPIDFTKNANSAVLVSNKINDIDEMKINLNDYNIGVQNGSKIKELEEQKQVFQDQNVGVQNGSKLSGVEEKINSFDKTNTNSFNVQNSVFIKFDSNKDANLKNNIFSSTNVENSNMQFDGNKTVGLESSIKSTDSIGNTNIQFEGNRTVDLGNGIKSTDSIGNTNIQFEGNRTVDLGNGIKSTDNIGNTNIQFNGNRTVDLGSNISKMDSVGSSNIRFDSNNSASLNNDIKVMETISKL